MDFRKVCHQFIALAGIATNAAAQDTERVNSAGAGLWGSHVRLTHEFTIGELDGAPEYEFGSVRLIAAESGGAFYVYDDRQDQIRRYDANGGFDGLIGRRGGGPGEYKRASGMRVTREGFLLVYDPALQRLTYFQSDG